jgi:hypothetical protein
MNLNKIINEDLTTVKFLYQNHHHDPKIKHVKVLDFHYEGRPFERNYPNSDDILGIEIDDDESIENIVDNSTSFSHMLDDNLLKTYRRMRDLSPDILPYVRRYKPHFIKGLKKYTEDGLWKSAEVSDLDKEELF